MQLKDNMGGNLCSGKLHITCNPQMYQILQTSVYLKEAGKDYDKRVTWKYCKNVYIVNSSKLLPCYKTPRSGYSVSGIDSQI